MAQGTQQTDSTCIRRAAAAWYLLKSHRVLWSLALWPMMLLVIGTLMLRSTAENPETNLVKSIAAAKAREPAPVPDEENAAVLYQKAFASFPKYRIKDFDKDPEGRNAALTPEFLRSAEVQAFIQACRPGLQWVRDAARMQKCNWGTDYSKGSMAPMNYFSGLRRSVRLLALEAADFAQKGDHAAASENLRAMTRLIRHATVDQSLIGELVLNALRGIRRNTMQMIVFLYCPERPEEIAAYREACTEDHDHWREMRDAMAGERHLMLIALDQVAVNRTLADLSSFTSIKVPLVPWYGSDRKTLLAIFSELESNLEAQRWEFIREPDDVRLARLQAGPVFFAPMMVPVLHRSVRSALESAQAERVMDLALRALQFRLKYGRDIAATQELLSEFNSPIPRDIFYPEKTLLMRRDGHGYFHGLPNRPGFLYINQPGLVRFYASGRNGRDDGGYALEGDAPLPKEKEIRDKYPDADDITFALPPFQALAPAGRKDPAQ